MCAGHGPGGVPGLRPGPGALWVPDEVLTDNGKQFTARFGRGGEVLFDRICRDNGIVHRLTQPATPTTTGKWSGSIRPCAGTCSPTTSPSPTSRTCRPLDDWVEGDYNTRRPHRSLDMASPADRFAGPCRRTGGVASAAPGGPAAAPVPRRTLGRARRALRVPALVPGAVEFDRVVPAPGTWPWRASSSGWDRTGPGSRSRSGPTTTSSTCSSLGPGSSRSAPICPPPTWSAWPPPAAALPDHRRCQLPRATAPQSRSTGRIRRRNRWARRPGRARRGDPRRAPGHDPHRRQEHGLLRPRDPRAPPHPTQPLHPQPSDPVPRRPSRRTPPRPKIEPVRVQRRASNSGVIMVAGQKVALGRIHAEPPSRSTWRRPPSPSKPVTATSAPSPAPPPRLSATSDPCGPAKPPYKS